MSKILTSLLLVGLFFIGASSAEAAKKGNKQNHTPEDRFKKLDTNSDNKISLDEFKAKKSKSDKDPEKIFKHKDKNSDGFLTLEEFKAEGKKKKS